MTNKFNHESLDKSLRGRILYLIGMMGSGKSLTGPFLAKLINYSFVDQDTLIEEVAKKSVADIFHQEGEEEFRNIETKVLKEIGKRHSLVVATGGGVVMRPENWGVLHQGIVIWINPTRQCLVERLESDSNKRPLLRKNNFLSTIESLMKERKPFYSESDLEILVDQETPEQVAKGVVQQLSDLLFNQDSQDERQTIG